MSDCISKLNLRKDVQLSPVEPKKVPRMLEKAATDHQNEMFPVSMCNIDILVSGSLSQAPRCCGVALKLSKLTRASSLSRTAGGSEYEKLVNCARKALLSAHTGPAELLAEVN